MKNKFCIRHIIDITILVYIIVSISVFIISNNLDVSQIEHINNILDSYLWGNIGIYSIKATFYTKLVVNIFATITPIFIVIFFPYRKDIHQYRKKNTYSEYMTILTVPTLYCFLWGGNWELITNERYSLFRELLHFNALVCILYAVFISEIWYLYSLLYKLLIYVKR